LATVAFEQRAVVNRAAFVSNLDFVETPVETSIVLR